MFKMSLKSFSQTIKSFLAVFMMGILFFSTTAFSGEHEVFYVDTLTNYKNPDTQEIDDFGTKNEAIGGGMCRSIVDPIAIIEEYPDHTYATFRLKLISNITDIELSVQTIAGDPDSYKPVFYDIMKENGEENSADFRFPLPSIDTNVRFLGYVTPMGRQVLFYFNASSEEMIAYDVENDRNFVVTDFEDMVFPAIEEVVETMATKDSNNKENQESNGSPIPLAFIAIGGIVVIGGIVMMSKRGGNQ